jgi:Ca2+-binding EF-hand superfamily protein
MNIRLSFYDTDFAKLETQIKQFRSLFTVFAQDEGVMTYEDLRILLLSTGVNDAQIAEIAVLLNFKDALPGSPVKFLDFLTYIPFFTQLHQSIVDDPFGNRGSMTSLLKK